MENVWQSQAPMQNFLVLVFFFPDLSCRIILTLIDETRPELEVHMLFIDTIMQGTCNLHGSSSKRLYDSRFLSYIPYTSSGQPTTMVARSNSSAFYFLIKY